MSKWRQSGHIKNRHQPIWATEAVGHSKPGPFIISDPSVLHHRWITPIQVGYTAAPKVIGRFAIADTGNLMHALACRDERWLAKLVSLGCASECILFFCIILLQFVRHPAPGKQPPCVSPDSFHPRCECYCLVHRGRTRRLNHPHTDEPKAQVALAPFCQALDSGQQATDGVKDTTSVSVCLAAAAMSARRPVNASCLERPSHHPRPSQGSS